MKLAKLAFGSDEMFAVLAARPEWGRYFAVGEQVTVVLDGTAYQVGDQAAPPVAIPATLTPTVSAPAVPSVTPAPTRTPTAAVRPAPSATVTASPVTLPPVTAPETGPLEQFWQWLLSLFGAG